MSFTDTLKEWFPLARGRTGVGVLTQTVPIVLRFYTAAGRRLITHRTKVKCRKKVFPSRQLEVATKALSVPYKTAGLVTKITISVDYPFLDQLETELPGVDPIELKTQGTITVIPADGQLLTIL